MIYQKGGKGAKEPQTPRANRNGPKGGGKGNQGNQGGKGQKRQAPGPSPATTPAKQQKQGERQFDPRFHQKTLDNRSFCIPWNQKRKCLTGAFCDPNCKNVHQCNWKGCKDKANCKGSWTHQQQQS